MRPGHFTRGQLGPYAIKVYRKQGWGLGRSHGLFSPRQGDSQEGNLSLMGRWAAQDMLSGRHGPDVQKRLGLGVRRD